MGNSQPLGGGKILCLDANVGKGAGTISSEVKYAASLVSRGFQVTTVCSISQALEQIVSRGPWIALVSALGSKPGQDLLFDRGDSSTLISAAKRKDPEILFVIYDRGSPGRKVKSGSVRHSPEISSPLGLLDPTDPLQPAFMSSLPVEEKERLVRLIMEAGEQYGHVKSDNARQYVATRFGIFQEQAEEAIDWLLNRCQVTLPKQGREQISQDMRSMCLRAGADAVVCSSHALIQLVEALDRSRSSGRAYAAKRKVELRKHVQGDAQGMVDLSHEGLSAKEFRHLAKQLRDHKSLACLDLQSNLLGPLGAQYLSSLLATPSSSQALSTRSGAQRSQELKELASPSESSQRAASPAPSSTSPSGSAAERFADLPVPRVSTSSSTSSHALSPTFLYPSPSSSTQPLHAAAEPEASPLASCTSPVAVALASPTAQMAGVTSPRPLLSLQELRLDNNGLGDEGVKLLADSLTGNPYLKRLQLGWNNIGPLGAEAIGEALRVDSALTALDLQHNSIGKTSSTRL